MSVRAMTTTIAQASRMLFGNVEVTAARSSRKLMRKKLIGQTLIDWYPPSLNAMDKEYTTAVFERRQLKLEKLRRKGKGPPKKGSGKAAQKRNR
jgi:small subunit ribosomal protein S33